MANRRTFSSPWDEIEYLYSKAAHWIYGCGKPRRATPYVRRLKVLIAKRGQGDAALCVLEAEGLLAHWEGDRRGELRCRRRLVDFLLHLMDVAEDVPGYEPPVVLLEMEGLARLLEGNGRRFEARDMAAKCRAFARKYRLAVREGAAGLSTGSARVPRRRKPATGP